MGRRLLPAHARVLRRRLPGQAAQGALPARVLPPQRLPFGHRLPVDPQRGRGLEAVADGPKRAARRAGAPGGPEPQVAGAERRLRAVRQGARGVLEEGQGADREVPAALVMVAVVAGKKRVGEEEEEEEEEEIWERAG